MFKLSSMRLSRLFVPGRITQLIARVSGLEKAISNAPDRASALTDSAAGQLGQDLSKCDAAAEALRRELEARDATLAERDAQLVEARRAVYERDTAVVALREALADRDRALGERTAELAEMTKVLSERDTAVVSLCDDLASQNHTIFELEGELENTQRILSERNRELAGTSQFPGERAAGLAEARGQLAKREAAIEALGDDRGDHDTEFRPPIGRALSAAAAQPDRLRRTGVMPEDRMPPRTDIVVPICGDVFWELFVDYVLPTHLTAGNVRGLCELGARWRIFCRRAEYEKYNQSPHFRRLIENFPVEMVDLSRLENAEDTFQYALMTRCHQQAICEAEGALMFINADQISSSNSYSNLARIVGKGARAVMVQGLRLVQEQFIEKARCGEFSLDGFHPRELMRVAWRMLHPMSKGFIVTSSGNRSLGSHYWIHPTKGILAHCFHTHPLFLWPDHCGGIVGTTIDHELVRISVSHRNSIVLIQDSDVILQCALTPSDHLIDDIASTYITLSEAAAWAKTWSNGLHREFFATPIWFKLADVEGVSEIECRARCFVRSYLEVLNREYGSILGPDMAATRNFYATHGLFMQARIPRGNENLWANG
jgi:hypothetical protein